MADEEETPSATAVEAPPVVETPDPPEPLAEQEQVESEESEETDSGAEQDEDKGEEPNALEQVREEIRELAKTDPETAAQLRKDLGEAEEKPVDDERYEFELEQAQRERQQVWTSAQSQYNQFEPNAVAQSLTTFFTDLNAGVMDAATKLQNGDIQSPDGVAFSVADVVQALTPFIENARNAGQGLSRAAGHYTGFEGLEQDASHRLLTTDERALFATFRQQNNLAEAQKLQLQAAGRGPSLDALTKKAEAAAEKKNATMAQAEKVANALKKNGKVAGGDAPSKGPSTLEEIDDALVNGPTEAIDGLLKRRAALVG